MDATPREGGDGRVVIELMLQAERNLAMGLVEQAERLYRQVLERDPRNAIAVVGLARVAIARDDDRGAYALAIDALRIDPQNAAAIKLEGRLAEVFAERGESFEREPFAVRIAAADSDRAQEQLRAGARSAPPPAPGKPDYAPTPGTRFEQIVKSEAASQPMAGTDGAGLETPPVATATSGATPAPEKAGPAPPAATAPSDQGPPPERPAEEGAAATTEERPGLLQRLVGLGRSDK
jgi:tetratricopeptide (TPR) repeat protein